MCGVLLLSVSIGATIYLIYSRTGRSTSSTITWSSNHNTAEAHHEFGVHDDWAHGSFDNNQDGVWSQSGGIWSKSNPRPNKDEIVVKVQGEFVPGEQEIPGKTLGEGHSPMK